MGISRAKLASICRHVLDEMRRQGAVKLSTGALEHYRASPFCPDHLRDTATESHFTSRLEYEPTGYEPAAFEPA